MQLVSDGELREAGTCRAYAQHHGGVVGDVQS
jgi:hypothetical protein